MNTDSSRALITGGTSGIGRAAANKLAALGIHVVGRDVGYQVRVDDIAASRDMVPS